MKFRKLISLVLVIAMAAIPVLSLGESEAPASFLDQRYAAGRNVKTTVTFTPGAIFAMDPNLSVAADLLKVLKIESSTQKQGETSLDQLELFLQDKSAVSMSFLSKGDAFHILSSLLGGKVLSFTMDELVDLYITVLTSSAQGATLDPAQLELLRESFKESLRDSAQRRKEIDQMTEFSIVQSMGFDKDIAQKDLFDPLLLWYEGILSKSKTTTGTFQSKKHDDAVTEKVYTISADQIGEALEIFTAWAVQDKNLDRIIESTNSNITIDGTGPSREEVRRLLLSLPSEFKKDSDNILKKPITFTELFDASGVRKAMEITAEIPEGTEENSIVHLTFGQYEKTEEDGIVTQYDFNTISTQGEFSLSFVDKYIPVKLSGDTTVTKSQWKLDGAYKSKGLTMGGLSLAFDGENTAAASLVQDEWKLDVESNGPGMAVSGSLNGKEKTVTDGVDAKAEGTVDLYVYGSSEPALSIVYTTASSEAAVLPEIPSDSVHLGKMTMEELTAWAEEIEPVLQGQMMVIMGNLPPSIIKLIMGGPKVQ